MEVLAQYGIAVPVFLAIDLAWIVVIARGFYKRQLGRLLADDVNWAAAIAFYLLFIVGIIVFAVNPAANAWQALGLGALFGLVSYATYDLTNLATTRGWPATLTAVDLAWGTTLSGSVSAVTRARQQIGAIWWPSFPGRGVTGRDEPCCWTVVSGTEWV